MNKEKLVSAIKKVPALARKYSTGKVLWIWALALIAGFSLFRFMNKSLPGMNTTLVFATWWGEELEEQCLEKLIGKFAAQNPRITIKLEKKDWEEIQQLLDENRNIQNTGRIAQKQKAPDIFSIDPYALYELESRSYLAAQKNEKGETATAIPIISFISPLFYNTDLLNTTGFGKPPKNQTEFLSYAQRLKETGTSGAGLALNDLHSISQQLLSWIWAAAGNPSSETFSFTSKETIDTLNFLNQLKPALYGNPFEINEAALLSAFSQKKVGMFIGSSSDIKKLMALDVKFAITTIPTPESYTKKPIFPPTVWYAGINSQCEFRGEAQQFINFLKENAETIAAAAYAVPGNGRRNRELSKNDPAYAKAFDMYEGSEMAYELYRMPYINGFFNTIRRETEEMFKGNKTPQQCAEAIQEEWSILTGTKPVVR